MGEIEGCAIGENVEGVAIGCVVPMGEVEGCAVGEKVEGVAIGCVVPMGEVEGCAVGENVEGVAIGCVVPMGEVEGCAVGENVEGVAIGCVGATGYTIGATIGRGRGVKTGADFPGDNSANFLGTNRLDVTVVKTVRLTAGKGFTGNDLLEEVLTNRLGATEGMIIGVAIDGDGCAVLGSGAFKDDSVASGGFVKEGNRGAKTVLVFLRDDSVEDVDTGGVGVTETGGCELGWSGINRLAVPTVTAVMLPKANRVLDIQSFP
jgi:hypothetical protein